MIRYRYARRAADLRLPSRSSDAGIIVLTKGKIATQLLPKIAYESGIAAQRPYETMQTGPVAGLDDLRDQIVQFVADDGVYCERNEVLVTNGAKHALDLACRVFLEPGDRVIVSAPAFLTALRIIRAHGAEIIAVPQDEDGLDVTLLERILLKLDASGERLPKLLFEVADFGNPSGITLSAERRRRLVDLAKKFGFVILEDSAYRRIRFEGKSAPSIKSFDDQGVVVVLGTFSKILAPGFRLGWAIGTAEVVKRMAMLRAEGGSSPFVQRLAVELFLNGRVGEQTDRIKNAMRNRRDVAMAAVAHELPDVSFRRPDGSFFLWLQLPAEVSASAVAAKALEDGVEVISGRDWFPGSGRDDFLRLAYSHVSLDKLEEGIRRLGAAYRTVARPV